MIVTEHFSPGEINLKEGSKVTRIFKYIPAASSTEKGSIPYNTTVDSVVVTAYNSDGTDVTTLLIYGTPSVANNLVTITFQDPGINGNYTILIIATLSNSDTDVRTFDRIVVERSVVEVG